MSTMKFNFFVSGLLSVVLLSFCSPVWGVTRSGGSIGVRVDAGASWSFGSPFTDASVSSPVRPCQYGQLGVHYYIIPRLRAGVDYSYTRRSSDLSGAVASSPAVTTLYRDVRTDFHGLSLRAEYNLLPSGTCGGRLSLYAGAGAGCLFSVGSTYTLSASSDRLEGAAGSSFTISGHNENHRHTSLFVPLGLSLEYEFLPQVSLSLSGEYRFNPVKEQLVPNGQAAAMLGLRFRL